MFLANLQSCIGDIDRKVVNILLTPCDRLKDRLSFAAAAASEFRHRFDTDKSLRDVVRMSEKQSLFGTGQAIFRQ